LPLVVGGAIFAMVYAITKTEVSGQLALNAEGESGKMVFVPTECSSGQPFGFLGVDLRSATAGQGLRIVSDPIQGPVLILQRSPGDARQVPLGQCKTAQVEAHPTNTTINEVRVVEGHATLDCEHVQADLKFSGCH
jgi:hypothetical protein